MTGLSLRFLASTAILGTLILPSVAIAETKDEIIITAQKREKTLQDTPIAVTAISADDIKQSQIRDIRDMPLLASSFHVYQQASSSQAVFVIRGIGTSGFNAGLEPSVGVFVDGVYRSRQGASIGDFPTLERIEILRGPQSTIYGKNTPAGVVSIITKKPQYEYGYDGEATYGNYNSIILKGSVTGPIHESDKAAVRFSATLNKRDGFLENLFDGRDLNDRNRWSMRGQVLLEPTDKLSIRFIGDFAAINEACCAAPFTVNSPANAAALTAVGGTVLTTSAFDRKVRFDEALLTEQETAGFSAQVDYDLGFAELTSITAVRTFDEVNNIDPDFVDVDLTDIRRIRDVYNAYTQELRLTSTGDNMLDWMVGAYYYRQDLKHGNSTKYGTRLRPFADVATSGLVSGLEGIMGATQGVAPGTFLATGNGLVASQFNQDTESFAAFASFDAHVNDQFTITAGARWSTETKKVNAQIRINDMFSALRFRPFAAGETLGAGQIDATVETGMLIQGAAAAAIANPSSPLFNAPLSVAIGALTPRIIAGLRKFQFFVPTASFADSITNDNLSGNLIFSYEWSDQLTGYASWTRGYKAGGFNLSNDSRAGTRAFRPEQSTNYELGLKTNLYDGRAQFNVALFHQELNDFQSNGFNGTAFVLNNAGKISANGFEIDAVLTPRDDVTFTFGGTYLDDVYDSFLLGPCTIADEETVASCIATGSQDFTGRKPGTAVWNLTSTFTHTFPIAAFDAFVRSELRYVSDQNLAADLDPAKAQGAFTVVNGSFGFGKEENGWQVQVWGRNLFDQDYLQGAFNSIGQPGNLNGYPGDPRTFGITLRMFR